jgi:hypothetical protein
MDEVLRETEVIVRGTIGPGRTYLSKDQMEIYTDYPLINAMVLFDPVVGSSRTPGGSPREIIVTILGGVIQIGGLTFTSRPEALPELPIGAEALFLLKRVDGRYQLAGRYYGAFEIKDDHLKRPFMKKEDFAEGYRGAPVSATAQSWVAAVAKARQGQK